MTESKQNLILPISIVAAAVIIAAGLVLAFSDVLSSSDTPKQAEDDRPNVEEAAREVSVNKKDILACVEAGEMDERVDRDLASARLIEANGTPTSVVIGPDGNTITIPGAQPLAAWQQIVDLAYTGELFEDKLEGDLADNIEPVTDEDHIRGNVDAEVTIIEYSDIDCPFCQRLHGELKTLIEQRDDVRWVYRHLPITSLPGHANAYRKSAAAECVYTLSGNDDEEFFTYLDALIGE